MTLNFSREGTLSSPTFCFHNAAQYLLSKCLVSEPSWVLSGVLVCSAFSVNYSDRPAPKSHSRLPGQASPIPRGGSFSWDLCLALFLAPGHVPGKEAQELSVSKSRIGTESSETPEISRSRMWEECLCYFRSWQKLTKREIGLRSQAQKRSKRLTLGINVTEDKTVYGGQKGILVQH